MHRVRNVVAIGLLAFSVQGQAADWLGDDISEVVAKVRSIYTTVVGDVKDTAGDLKRQLTSLAANGQTLKDTVDDMLEFLRHRRTPLQDFVNGGTGRCGAGSPCYAFRADLRAFVLDMADLRTRFAQIDRNGLGDGQFMASIVDIMPPIALFGLYEIFQRVPDWQEIPFDLADLYDEVDDADVFAFESAERSAAVATTSQTRTPSRTPGGQWMFGSPATRTDVFCAKGKLAKMDNVRMNRVRAGFFWTKSAFGAISEYAPEFKDVTLAGEGTSVHLPIRAMLKSVPAVIESIFASIDAFRANLGECKRIETDIAQHAQLYEYRTSAGNKKAYWVVRGLIDGQGLVAPEAEDLLTQAANLHRNYRWQAAYDKICDAYAKLL